MGAIKISVKLPNLSNVKGRMKNASGKAMHIMAIQMAKDTEPFVPMRTGSLKNRTRVKEDEIIYPGPYAHYLYVGKLMVDPATGSAWASYGTTKVYTEKPLNISKSVHPQATDHWFEASKAINKDKWVRVAGRAIQREF